jgi:uncharacterized protein (DUF58 family)
MRLTRRGIGASFVAIALASTAALYHDLLIGVALLSVLVVIACEAAWVVVVVRRPDSRISLAREQGPGSQKRREVIYPGDESVERFHLTKKVGGRLEFESRVRFLTISPKVIDGAVRADGAGRGGDRDPSKVELRFKTRYAGEYSSGEVGVSMTGPVGLFSGEGAIRLAQRYVVHPRLLSVASTTFKLLGSAQFGESSIEAPGVGSEFYEMRAYQPGDEYRRVNWKATARQGKLLVNDSTRDVGSSYIVVLDARAPGFFETDRLASTFLSIANNLAGAGISFCVFVHDGARVTSVSPDDDPHGSLAVALKAAMKITRLESDQEFLELAPTRPSHRLATTTTTKRKKTMTTTTVIGMAGADDGRGRAGTDPHDEPIMAQMLALRSLQSKSVLEHTDPWVSASRYIRERSARSVVYVSGLFGEVEPLIDLGWQARHLRDADFAVANPCQPWVWAETEEAAAAIHSRYRTLARALAASGIRYFSGEPVELAARCISG